MVDGRESFVPCSFLVDGSFAWVVSDDCWLYSLRAQDHTKIKHDCRLIIERPF